MSTTQHSREIPMKDIAPISNIRATEGTVEDLVESLRVQGQLEPVLVRPAPKGVDHTRPYELVFGYRRYTAALDLEWTSIRAEIRDVGDEELLDLMITENLQREDLSPIAEARAMKTLIDTTGVNRAEIGRRLGISSSQVTRRLDLLELTPAVVELVDKGEVPPSHAEALSALPAAEQERLAERVKRDGVSVRRLESWVREIQDEAAAPVPTAPAALDPVRDSDVVLLPQATLRDDLSDTDWDRLATFIILRNGMDMEMLEYLEEKEGIKYGDLWGWMRNLSDGDVANLQKRLSRRWAEAAHRYPSLEDEFLIDLSDGPAAALPGADDQSPGEIEVIDLDDEDSAPWNDEWESDLSG